MDERMHLERKLGQGLGLWARIGGREAERRTVAAEGGGGGGVRTVSRGGGLARTVAAASIG
jgi:hypothetical protein